ncbi:hypothetical protein FOL47_006711 [Perkinsus chesapeaki]|uniref:Uncharacterized protein n=1 Tax=Perkinsus chesapeaki TaxID=330153 RepID=A0A7J6MX17_PERCH|nr:hypothetical protein FOL47_006711 [Perkinsus chesapeaki]
MLVISIFIFVTSCWFIQADDIEEFYYKEIDNKYCVETKFVALDVPGDIPKLTLVIWSDGVKLYESPAMDVVPSGEHSYIIQSGNSLKIYKEFMNKVIPKCEGKIKAGDLSWFDNTPDDFTINSKVGGNPATLIWGFCHDDD